MEFGEALGLSQDMQFDQRINDLRYQNQLIDRAKAHAAASAKMFADEFSQGPIGSQFDDPIIKDYTKKKMLEAAQIMRNNPNYKYNPDALAQLKVIQNDIKGNPHVLRAVAFVDAKKKLQEDLAEAQKNPAAYDQEAYQDIINQVQNYDRYGHQMGKNAAEAEGPQPFIYKKPQNLVDVPETLLKLGQGMKNYDVIKPKGGNIGEYYTVPKPGELESLKTSAYGQHLRSIQVAAKRLGLTTPEQIDAWVTQGITAGFDKDYHIGDPNAAFSNAMRMKEYNLAAAKHAEEKMKKGDPNYTPFDYFTDPRNPVGHIDSQTFNKVWGNNHDIKISGNHGGKIDLSDMDFKTNGRYFQKQGITWVDGYVDVPKEIAEQRGAYKSGAWTIDGVTSDFEGIANEETITGKDGKPVEVVRFKYQLPINRNDQVARQKFNVFVDPDKLVPPSSDPFKQESQSNTIVQNGYTYTFNPATGKYE